MSTKETRAIIERAIYLGMENYELIADELLAEDVVNHGPGKDDFGREAYKRRQAQFLDSFTNMKWTVDAAFADGNMGCVRYTFAGIHTGALESIAPTPKRVTMSGVTVARISNGKVVELWAHPDRLGLLEQLGVLPAVY